MNSITKQKKLKILFVIEAASGGAGRHVCDISEHMSLKGHEVHLIYSPLRMDNNFARWVEKSQVVKKFALPLIRNPSVKDLKAISEVRKYIRQNGGFDIVHAHGAKGGMVGRIGSLFTSARRIYTAHGFSTNNAEFGFIKKNIFRAIELNLSHITKRIIAVSEYEKRHAIKFLKISKRKVVVIPNRIGELDRSGRKETRKQLAIGKDELCLGFVGMFYHAKGVDTFLKLVKEVLKQQGNIKPVVLGGGPLKEKIRNMAKELGILEKVIWLEGREAREIMPAFDIMVVPSRNESMPYAVLEAMALGIAVAAFDVGGIKEMIKDGENGLLSRQKDFDGLLKNVLRLAESPIWRSMIGENARKTSNNSSVEKMVENITEVYNQ